jgi:hypothetical protein
VITNELVGMWKEMVVYYFDGTQFFSGGSEDNYEVL